MRPLKSRCPHPLIRAEEGSALMMTIAILLALSLLAALGMFAAHADLLISLWTKKEREVFYAAEAGLEEALSKLHGPHPPTLAEEAFHGPWEDPLLPVQKGTAGRCDLRWSLRHLPDPRDLDGNPSTPVILFNRRFGYGLSPCETGGYPVFPIAVLAEMDGARKALVAEVTPLPMNPVVEAAWSAGGGIVLDGPIMLSGMDHDAGGALLPDRSRDLPGILAGGPVGLHGEAHVAGAEGGGSTSGLPEDPLAVLNAGGTLKSLANLRAPDGEGELGGVLYARASFHGPLSGEGILVVHNPLFQPGPFEASRLFLEEGVLTEDYDPEYSHLDPDCQPAVLDILSGGEFRGLIVADAVTDVGEATVITGAIVTLSRSPLRVRAEASLNVLFSAEVLAKVGRGPLSYRLCLKALEQPSGHLSHLWKGGKWAR